MHPPIEYVSILAEAVFKQESGRKELGVERVMKKDNYSNDVNNDNQSSAVFYNGGGLRTARWIIWQGLP